MEALGELYVHINLDATDLLILALALILSCPAYTGDKEEDKPKHKKTIAVSTSASSVASRAILPIPDDGNQCRVRNRITLLMQHIAAVLCPDLITLQENVTSSSVPADGHGGSRGSSQRYRGAH